MESEAGGALLTGYRRASNILKAETKKGDLPEAPETISYLPEPAEAALMDALNEAAERGRSAAPELKLGICGEHRGDPQSIAFCERIGLAYVSCSPYRIPIARLAAAQAALNAKD